MSRRLNLAGGPLPGDDRADGPESPENGVQNGAQAGPDERAAEPAPALPDGPPELLEAAQEFERRARLAEDRLAEVLAAYRQLKTDNEGFRERATKNLERRFDQRRERLLLKFIDILDNLDRALEAAEQSYAGGPLIEGLILVRTQLLQTLQEEGLERIPVLGLPYDPNFSEAVGTAPVRDAEHHHVVVKELLRGYRLNGRIARASRVVVGEYSGPGAAAAAPKDEGTLIGVDEVGAAEAAPAPRKGREPSLEEIVARAELTEDDLLREAREALDPLYKDEGEE
jgi:molecular chaperone GrpE